MAGYDPRLDPNLQGALQGTGSQYAPFELPSGSAPFTPEEMAVMGAMAQPNAPGMTETPAQMAPMPQVLPGGQPLPMPGPDQAPQPPKTYKQVPLSQLNGQPDDGGYTIPDLSQLGQRRGGAPSQAKKRMEEAFGGMTGAIGQRQEAAREIADARAGVGRSMADIRANANVDDEMFAQQVADEAERHQAAVDAVQARQQADADFIRTFEPSDRRNTEQRAMSAVAVALSGLGDAISMRGGNQNPGYMKPTLGIIDKAIDRDLEYQREMLNNKRTALAAGNTELGQMRERYGDNIDAMKMARVVKLDQYQRAIDSAMQQGASAEAVAAGKDTQAQLELQKQQLMYEVYGAQYQAEMRARAGGGVMGQLKVQEQMLKNEKLRNELGGGKGSAQDVPGFKRTKDVAPAQVTEANKAAGAAASLNASLDQLAKMRDEYEKTSVTDVAKRDALAKRARQLIGNYADTASQLAGGGQAGEAAKQQAMQDIPDPTQWSMLGRADPNAVYQGLKQQNAQQAAARLRALGYEPEKVTAGDLDLRSE